MSLPTKFEAFYVPSMDSLKSDLVEIYDLAVKAGANPYDDPRNFDTGDWYFFGVDKHNNNTEFYDEGASYAGAIRMSVGEAIGWLRGLLGLEEVESVVASIEGVDYTLTPRNASKVIGAILTIQSAKA